MRWKFIILFAISAIVTILCLKSLIILGFLAALTILYEAEIELRD